MAHYALIMAGGSGTRFWPASRREKPKQLLKLFSDKTMLEETVERIQPLVSIQNIFIVCNKEYVDQVCDCLPQLPPENVIGEPVGRNTAPCIALISRILLDRDPESVMCVLPADHYIGDLPRFRQLLDQAMRAAEEKEDILVTFGVIPTKPHTGYGYIQAGDTGSSLDGTTFLRAERFVEKPDRDTAEDYLTQGNYYWNSGMFAWKSSAVYHELQTYLPAVTNALDEFFTSGRSVLDESAFEQMFVRLPSISIDYAVMEKSSRVVVARCDFEWNDVGSWDALEELLQPVDGSICIGTQPILLDSRRCILYGEKKLLACLGVEDLIIAAYGDAVLVAKKERAQEVKLLVEMLQARNEKDHL